VLDSGRYGLSAPDGFLFPFLSDRVSWKGNSCCISLRSSSSIVFSCSGHAVGPVAISVQLATNPACTLRYI
jgi:hypothetical protein